MGCDVNIDVLSSIIGPWGFQNILWTKAEREGTRIAMTPLNFQKSLIPLIFFEKKLNIIFFRTYINLNNGLLIFLLKTYNLRGVFLVLYLHYYHSSAKILRSLSSNGIKNIRSLSSNGIKSYLYHRARSHYHWIPCSFLFLWSMKTRSALVKTKKCGSMLFFGDRS